MSVTAEYDDVVATRPPSAIKYRYRSATASQGGNTLPGQANPVPLRSSRSAASTTNTTRIASKEPSTRGDVQATRRKASQGVRHTEDHALNPVQRQPQPEEYDYEEYFDAEENPYTAQTEQLVPQKPPQRQLHPLTWVGVGMCTLLLLLVVTLHVCAWWTNTVADPYTYSQVAHRNTLMVQDAQGHQQQFHAFVDAQGYLDELVIPDGQVNKAHIVQGPLLTTFAHPQQAMLTVVTSHGQQIITATGPIEVSLLGTSSRPQVQWIAAAQPSSKGGK